MLASGRNACLIVAAFSASLLSATADLIFGWLVGNNAAVAETSQFQTLLMYALVGLPVALVISFLAGGQSVDRAIAKGRLHMGDAARTGARIGCAVGIASLAFTFLIGVFYRLNDNAGFGSYLFAHQTVSDGMPTLLGWALEFGGFVVTTVIGVVSAVAGWFALRQRQPAESFTTHARSIGSNIETES